MMTILNNKPLILLSFLTVLFGCSTLPQPLILAPSVVERGEFSSSAPRIYFSVKDSRPNPAILIVEQNGQSNSAYTPNLINTLSLPLANGLKRSGLTLTPHAQTQFNLVIKSLISNVEQTSIQYQNTANAEFEIMVFNGTRKLVKTFSGQRSLQGPLKYDNAKIEQEMNLLISSLFDKILKDEEITQFIEGL